MPTKAPAELRTRAEDRYRRGDFAGALELYRRLAERQPGDAGVLNDLGTVYFALGQLGESCRCYVRALDADSRLEDARANLATACASAGLNVESVTRELAHELDAERRARAAALADEASELMQRGKVKAALAHLDKARAIGPRTPELSYGRALALSRLGLGAEAACAARAELAVQPRHAGALRLLRADGPGPAPRAAIVRMCGTAYLRGDFLAVNWVLTRRCSYDCPYCTTHDNVNGFFPPLADLKVAVDKIAAIGRARVIVTVSGGEPTIHPDCVEFLRYLAGRLDGRSQVVLDTNLSRSASFYRRMAEALADRSGDTFIEATYHPEFADPEEILDKARLLADAGFPTHLKALGHPEMMETVRAAYASFAEAALACERLRTDVLVVRDGPVVDGRYCPEDLDWIRSTYVAHDHPNVVVDYVLEGEEAVRRCECHTLHLIANGLNRLKGVYCNAGVDMLAIDDDGDTAPACCLRGKGPGPGSIFAPDGRPPVSAEPLICPRPTCMCNADLVLPRYVDGYGPLNASDDSVLPSKGEGLLFDAP